MSLLKLTKLLYLSQFLKETVDRSGMPRIISFIYVFVSFLITQWNNLAHLCLTTYAHSSCLRCRLLLVPHSELETMLYIFVICYCHMSNKLLWCFSSDFNYLYVVILIICYLFHLNYCYDNNLPLHTIKELLGLWHSGIKYRFRTSQTLTRVFDWCA